MTNPSTTSANWLNGQLFMDKWGDAVLCSKCKRTYWNDMDDQAKIDMVNTHPVYGNEFISLMSRSGRKDLVKIEMERLKAEIDAKNEKTIAEATVTYEAAKAQKLKDLEKEA
jgi:hypothetical protein